MNLRGKSALLTGASRGLGRELALQLDAQGCRLLLIARDAGMLHSLMAQLRTPGSQALPCDLTDPVARTGLVAAIKQRESRLDLLIFNAGIGSHSRMAQLSAPEVTALLQLNTLAPLALSAELFPLLPAGEPAGIVNIGSMAGELVMPGMGLYSASKAALHSFSRAAAIELAANGHFSLLVILGALRGTSFGAGIQHPSGSKPGWYRRLDVDAEQAASRIVSAIQKERSQLVIPGWYGSLIGLSRIFAPFSRAAAGIAYRRLHSGG